MLGRYPFWEEPSASLPLRWDSSEALSTTAPQLPVALTCSLMYTALTFFPFFLAFLLIFLNPRLRTFFSIDF